MPNHIMTSATRVPKGAAPDDCCPHTIRLRTKKTANAAPGKENATASVCFRQSCSWNSRNIRAPWYPAATPAREKSMSMAVIRPPRFAGLRNPSSANTMVTNVMTRSWTPVPTYTESSAGAGGGRKTSPCTSFHPVSSCASSRLSNSLYCEMSRRSVRTMIIATIPERKMRIMALFTTENQCISTSSICK